MAGRSSSTLPSFLAQREGEKERKLSSGNSPYDGPWCFSDARVITRHLEEDPSSRSQARSHAASPVGWGLEMRTGLTTAELRIREKIDSLTGGRGI